MSRTFFLERKYPTLTEVARVHNISLEKLIDDLKLLVEEAQKS